MSVAQKFILPSTLNKWNLQNLDYNWYFALTILGGYWGLDYLYLGSPLGALIKHLFNTQTYGFAWFYDMINAAISQDQIRLYGPVAPVLGATGLAAGRFRDAKYPNGPQEKLDKHLNFMIYGIVLCMFGFFGGDSFLTGHFMNGVIRLFSVIFIIGIPISLFWWGTNMYYYFLDTGASIDQHWDYFGAEAPSDQSAECPNVLMIFTVWLLKTILAILQMLPFFGTVASLLQDLIKNLEYAYGFVEPVVKEAVKAVDPLMGVVEAERNRPVPTVAELKAPMTGGGEEESSAILGPLLVLTVGFVVVSGIIVSLRRSRQNAAATKAATPKQSRGEETDEPPHPGNLRNPTPAN